MTPQVNTPDPQPARRGLTTAERAERNLAIVKARLEGRSWREIQEQLGVCRNTARRAVRDLAETITPISEGAEALDVEGTIGEGLRAQPKALSALVELLDADSPVTRIAAAGALSKLRSAFLADLRAIGLLADPDLEAQRQRHEAEVVALANEMVSAVQRFNDAARGIDQADPEDARAVLRAAADELVAAFERAIDPAGEPRDVSPVLAGRELAA